MIHLGQVDHRWIRVGLIHLKTFQSFCRNSLIHDPLTTINPNIWVTLINRVSVDFIWGLKVDQPLDHVDQGGVDPFLILLRIMQHIYDCLLVDQVDHTFSLDSGEKGKNTGSRVCNWGER